MAADSTCVIEKLVAGSPGHDLLLISRPISRELHYDLSVLIATEKQHQKCTVFLTTLGGDPDGG